MTFIYPHIFKTGGTSLEAVLRRVFDADKIVRVEDKDVSEYQDKDLLYGHMPYGLHYAIKQPCTYIGLVRDPVERVISSYYFIRGQPQHPMYQLCNEMSLLDALFSQEPYLFDIFRNHQTRILAGYTTEINKGRTAGSFLNIDSGIKGCDLEIALLNLKNFCFISTLEHLDISKLYRALGKEHQDLSFPRRGITKDRIPTSEIDEETLFLIKMMNLIDIELYNHIKDQ
jgi:hypothetical protein